MPFDIDAAPLPPELTAHDRLVDLARRLPHDDVLTLVEIGERLARQRRDDLPVREQWVR